MPNWKKVIVSGSNAILASLKVPSVHSNGSVSTGTNVVTVDSNGQIYMTGSYGGGGGSGFPFIGDAVITGSLTISGSFNAFTLDSDNIVLGSGSGIVMQAGADNNVILGTNTADSLTTGDQNVAIGHQALQALTTTAGNTAIGFEAAKAYTNANSVFIGYRAGKIWSTGNDNVVIGKEAADAHTSGATNVYIGYAAAGGGPGGGNNNVAIGGQAGKNLSTGINNVVLGKNAGSNLNSGTENIAIGTNALDSIAGGEMNIAIGYFAGASLDQDDGNIMIGFGSAADGTGNSELKIGSGSITAIQGNLATGDVTFASTASADYFAGNGSQVTGVVNTTGNAATATLLQTARNINGVSFNGSAAITVTAAGSTLSDTVTVAKGGTGATTLTATRVLIGNGTSAITSDSGFTYASNILNTEGLNISSVSAQNSEATSLMINGDGVVGTRELGSNAFNSTTIATNNNQLTNGAGFTTNTGTLTGNGTTNRVPIYNGTTSFTTDSGFQYASNILNTEGLNISAPANLSEELTSLMINGDGAVGTRELGQNAFNSTAIPTVANGANNRIATFSGASALNGEANFTFDGTTAYVNGALGVGTSSPTTTGLIRATNDVIAFHSSDKRLKENITPITSALNKLDKINGVEFDWIPKEGIHENEGHDVGVIAQEIEKVIPEIVQTRDNGYKAVKYEKIVPLLIEAIKELKAEIEELKKSK